MNNIELINELRKGLPDVVAAIGYGSGFYRQKGYGTNDKPDKDVILVVDNLYRFLAEDYHLNPEHFYAGANRKYRQIKDKEVKFFYHKIGCLKFQKDKYHFKLLVVDKEALLYDVLTWSHFGIAARLSKPIVYDKLPGDIEKAILYDRESAIVTALLSLTDEEITTSDLYKTISGFSYIGDWRMITHSEKKTKASDIVDGAFSEFENMYGDNHLIRAYSDKHLIQNHHPIEYVSCLPENLKNYILSKIDMASFDIENKDDLQKLSKVIKDYFRITNLANTPLLMYSCFKSLGLSKTVGHALSKRKNAKGW